MQSTVQIMIAVDHKNTSTQIFVFSEILIKI